MIISYILKCLAIQKLSSSYGLSTVMIPRRLCTDNAEMVALTGLLKFEHQYVVMFLLILPDQVISSRRQRSQKRYMLMQEVKSARMCAIGCQPSQQKHLADHRFMVISQYISIQRMILKINDSSSYKFIPSTGLNFGSHVFSIFWTD